MDWSRRGFIRTSAPAALARGCLGMPLLGDARAAAGSPPTGSYACPPCGLPCDKLVFDKPGTCSNCGMTLVPSASAADSPPSVAILLFNGAQLIDFAGPWEVFGTAGWLVHTVADKKDMLTAVFGEKIIPDYTFENSPKADVLLVPGGGVWDEAINNARLIAWVQMKSKEAHHVISVCTGAFLLQKAGLLAGQTATTTYGMIDDLAGPDTKVVHDKRFVSNSKIITTAGLSAGIDGALHVVSRIKGQGAAQSVTLEIEYNWDPSGAYARAALADRFLPDGLAYAKPKLVGAKAEMISTAGDRDHWETKILVSEPHTLSEIIDTLRTRIAATRGKSGMFKPVFHIRGATRIIARTSRGFTWAFADDDRRDWIGRCTVVRDTEEKDKFVVTLTLRHT
jgi:putative intracellular protease/amidase